MSARPLTKRSLSAQLITVVLVACSWCASAERNGMKCENEYCRATGTVGMDNQSYPYTVPSNADFDLIITLSSRLGDVDLYASIHFTDSHSFCLARLPLLSCHITTSSCQIKQQPDLLQVDFNLF
jgi:hypothetical protein